MVLDEATQDLPHLLVIVGPTASGKTLLAMELAAELDGEIVSADSVQIYRRFDIGSAKPTPEERKRVVHHLIDCVEPMDAMDAAVFAQQAGQFINDILQRGKLPIVCGGTFLWVRALLYGLAEAPPADPELRERHRLLAEREGRASLHALLSKRDPVAAQRLQPNDLVRVSRALEVIELTGVALSEWQARHGFKEPRYNFHLIGPVHERSELDQRIELRTRRMLELGWIDEVERLLQDGFGSARAMNSVGYRQIQQALATRLPIQEERLHESIVRATRIFARRQRTWLRDAEVQWVTQEAALRAGREVKELSSGR